MGRCLTPQLYQHHPLRCVISRYYYFTFSLLLIASLAPNSSDAFSTMGMHVARKTCIKSNRISHHNNWFLPIAVDDKIVQHHSFSLNQKNPQIECEETSKTGIGATLVNAVPSINVLAQLFVIGFFLGPALDGLQSRVELTVYDFGGVDIPLGFGLLKTNYFVFPLLGIYFSICGALFVMLDAVWRSKIDIDEGSSERDNSVSAIASIGGCTATLYTSSLLYDANVELFPTYAILAVWSLLTWVAADRSLVGVVLGMFCGILSPLIEIFLMDVFHFWYYPKGDFFFIGENSVASFVVFCYFSFTIMVGSLSRYLSERDQQTKN